MDIPLVDLQGQYQTIQPAVDAAVLRVLSQSNFILGSEVDAFERDFAAFIGTRFCVGVASGTDALSLSLRAAGIGPGDRVLLPANTFIATALAVSYAGATPVLADVEPDSLNLDVARARRSLPAGLKAIMPVHLYGQPADMDGVRDLAQEKGLLVFEDAAQAHGAVHRSGRCGTLGLAAGFSFYPGKNLGAYGDGGAVCTNDPALAEQLRLLRNWGSTVKYVHPIQGFNSRLDTLQAAVLGVKLKHLAEWNRLRRQVASWYREALAPLGLALTLPVESPWTLEHVYHLFVVRIHGVSRDAVLDSLKQKGIGAGIHYPTPIHLQGAYAALGLGPGSFPVAEKSARELLSLPIYPELTRDQVERIAHALSAAFRK